ncbi:MAG: ChbG/HpnK family deacetylase [Armatimonadota bacterium]|nr:ChbG/HpnK family deacetylase [bacterium]MDW8321539.1 ChbG/HpnK family deacetylase [Armatimonadota bacterium]
MAAGTPREHKEKTIRLIVRGDDMGSCHAANEACIYCYQQGIMRSVEVMVPAPWYPEAVQMLKQHHGLDVGVHLTLTSEWEGCKWGPVTRAPSLCDRRGYFFPTTSQRTDFPPNTGFLQSGYRLEEVEAELRAQIEIALEDIRQVSHLSCHMATPMASPDLRELTQELSREYRLPLEHEKVRFAGHLGGQEADAERKEAILLEIIDNLTPGDWLLIDHPGLDTPEMQALWHIGYEHVAQERTAVTYAFTSDRVMRRICERDIQLISYADLHRTE